MQTWPLAYWPDGSLKWTAHATGAGAASSERLHALARRAAPRRAEAQRLRARSRRRRRRRHRRHPLPHRPAAASTLIQSIERDGQPIARDGRLVCLRQDEPDVDEDGAVRREAFTGNVETVTVEQSGPVRAVVRIDGKHAGPGGPRRGCRSPCGSTSTPAARASASCTRSSSTATSRRTSSPAWACASPCRCATGRTTGTCASPAKATGCGPKPCATLTGLRRDPGESRATAQVAGKPTPPVDALPEQRPRRLDTDPRVGRFHAGPALRRRVRDPQAHEGRPRLDQGRRRHARGGRRLRRRHVAAASAFGLRDFWQRHPTQLDVRGAAADARRGHALALLARGAGDGPALLPRRHGAWTRTPKQLEGAGDHVRGLRARLRHAARHRADERDDAVGAGSDAVAAGAGRHRRTRCSTPPLLVCAPEHYHARGRVRRAGACRTARRPTKTRIEDELDFLFDFYQKQIEQHRWYGFWDYGDVMHTLRPRPPRLALRRRRVRVGQLRALAGPVAVVQLPPQRPGRRVPHGRGDDAAHGRGRRLPPRPIRGARHAAQRAALGVQREAAPHQHGDYRRFYYYLTADERVGDLMRELRRRRPDVPQARPAAQDPHGAVHAAAARAGRRLRHRLGLAGGGVAHGVGAHRRREVARQAAGRHAVDRRDAARVLHRAARRTTPRPARSPTHGTRQGRRLAPAAALRPAGDRRGADPVARRRGPEFERAWLQYCELYNAGNDAQAKALGRGFGRLSARSARTRS